MQNAFYSFNHCNVCILALLLHIHDEPRHYCIHLCRVPPRTRPKKAETCSGTAICLYIIVYNQSSVAGIYRVFQEE